MKLKDLLPEKITENSIEGEILIPLSSSGYFDKSEFPDIIGKYFSDDEMNKMEKIIDKLRAQNDSAYERDRELPQSYLNSLNKISAYIAKRLKTHGHTITDTGESDDELFIAYH